MTVGNVNAVDGCKGIGNRLDVIGIGNNKDPVGDSVIGSKVVKRSRLFGLCNYGINDFVSAISKENRTCLGVTGIYVANAVFFFVGTGVFVFLMTLFK